MSVKVENEGSRAGTEVVQLYLHEAVTPVVTPVRELRGFKRVTLNPGQAKTVTFTLGPSDMQLLNKNQHWQVSPGTFEVMVGDSSVHTPETGHFTISRPKDVRDNKVHNL